MQTYSCILGIYCIVCTLILIGIARQSKKDDENKKGGDNV